MAKKNETTVVVRIVSKEMFPKHEVISALKWFFGCTRNEALKWYSETGAEYHNQIVMGFRENAKRAFAMD